MTNAEWCIKNGIPFKKVDRRPCSDSGYVIGYYDMRGSFHECYKGACLGELGEIVSISGSILAWLDMEHKEQILDDDEKKYLSAVIKPFRDKVDFICKENFMDYGCQRIVIGLIGVGPDMSLPLFKSGTMYKGMKPDRKYTLEELGL